MKKEVQYPLTYFTNRTIDELDTIIVDLKTILSKEDIAKIFVNNFNPEKFFEQYKIAVTDKFVWAIKHTMKYAIDTEMLIRYIYSKFDVEGTM
jgi:hypothetical protein